MKPLPLRKKYSTRECAKCKHLIACNCTIVGCTHFKLMDDKQTNEKIKELQIENSILRIRLDDLQNKNIKQMKEILKLKRR